MENSLRILILEDNPADAELVQFELREAGISFTAKLVKAQKDFIYELQEECPDLILSDYDLPQFNGAQALKLANQYCPNVPFILVTGAVSEERAIEILTGGATDYVLKHRLSRLAPAVRRAMAEADEIKARQAAEEALKESELQVREQLAEIQSIYNSAPVGLCVLDRELRFVRVNQRLAEIHGIGAAEHIGRTMRGIVHDLSAVIEEIAERIFQSGQPVLNVELTGTTNAQPGVRRTWRESWLPLKDSEGHVIGINVVVVEITEHKKLEDDLRESYKTMEGKAKDELLKSNKRLALLSATASRLLADNNPQQLVCELCMKVMEFLDCDVFFNFLVDENQGRLHLNAYAGIPKDAAREIEWLDFGIAVCGCAARDGHRIVAENILQTADVRTELVKSYGVQAYACHPLLDQNRVIGTLSFGARRRATFNAEDLAMMKTIADQVAVAMKRIQTEKALRQSEELYRSLMELSPCASFVSRDNHIEFMNDAALRLFGAETPQQILGKSLFDIFHPDSHVVIVDRLQQLLDGYAVPVIEEKMLRLDGTLRDVEVVAAPIGDAEDRVIQVVLYDVTERKKTEVTLQKEIIEHKLAEKEIRKHTSQLEEVNKELESFSYSVSHDLRAPLHVIDGFTRILMRDSQDKLDEEAMSRLELIRSSAGKMNDLIDDVLAFSRMSSQSMAVDVIDMKNLTAEVADELQEIKARRDVTVKISSLPAGYGDQKLVRQVIVNLLDNALKYTKNKAKAEIEVSSCEEAGETVYFVRDNGVGFDMKDYDKLFGIFQRLHREEEYEGTGVGLSIVKRIVQRHGGRVWAEGKVNGGATFYFSLPGKERINDRKYA
jgi:PAS domain S-box-containing protein